MPINLGVMDFAFMGGSMGSVVGEKIARLGQRSLERKYPLVLISASGGARMQEGVLSLMQMAKTSALLAQLAERRIPYVSVLTNPTTGGVSASFAMLGDAIVAEPGAVIGFAGPRVIKQTIGQDLPEGFQTAEFLLDHGMLDVVVAPPRSQEHRRRAAAPHERAAGGELGAPDERRRALPLTSWTRMSTTSRELLAQRSTICSRASTGGWKFGLERTSALLALLGDPHRRLPALHVAGTNGKGSVIATLDALLRARGFAWAVHLAAPDRLPRAHRGERRADPRGGGRRIHRAMDAGRRAIGRDVLRGHDRDGVRPLRARGVDVAVIEVGSRRPARRDECDHPGAAGVSSIGIDHVQYLGDTLELIAREKAGIFKRGVPAVIGEAIRSCATFLARPRATRARRRFPSWRMRWHDDDVIGGARRHALHAAYGGERGASHSAIGRHQADEHRDGARHARAPARRTRRARDFAAGSRGRSHRRAISERRVDHLRCRAQPCGSARCSARRSAPCARASAHLS